MSHHLLIVNTIGLTGAEILAADLARFPGVMMLPGQNFIQTGNCLYRPHELSGCTANDAFSALSLHQFTKRGRCWAGLTKHMSETERKAYRAEDHRRLFVAGCPRDADFLDLAENFVRSYYAAAGLRQDEPEFVGFFGHNFLLNASAYRAFDERTTILGWNNGIYLWLAQISQTMTWDATRACKFWIVNSLLAALAARSHPRFLEVSMEQHVADGPASLARIASFLRRDPKDLRPLPPGGFLRYDPAIPGRALECAVQLRRIYQGLAMFEAAEQFAEWRERFLDDAENRTLLERYRAYWNSTAHTNFDWIGPIEDEIAERALAASGARLGRRSLSYVFFHEYHALDSDTYDEPRSRAKHPFGMLEDEIELPLLPYYLSVSMEYLSEVARGYLRTLHSYRPMREGILYRRLASPPVQNRIKTLGLEERFARAEALIDEVERAVSSLERAVEIQTADRLAAQRGLQ